MTPARIGAVAALVLTLVLAPSAGAAVLYSNLEGGGGSSADEATNTKWLAQAFTPTTAGTARIASFYATSYLGQSASATVSIYSNGAGVPGAPLAAGVSAIPLAEETGPAPYCSVLNTTVALAAGTTYWAVLKSTSSVVANWRFGAAGGASKVSTNSGSTWGNRSFGGTFSFRVDDTPTCGPDITSNPLAGELLGDMYAKPAGTSFQTLFIGNDGNQALSLTGASYSGPDASLFKLFKGEPGGPEGTAFTFPKQVGAVAGGGVFLYIVCAPPAGTPDGVKTATLSLASNDPDENPLTWPVTCLLDSTPPSLEFTQNPNGRSGWFTTNPAPLQIRGIDPESNHFVKRIFCSDSAGPALDWDTGSIAFFSIAGDGVHNLSCQGTDVANNTSAPGAYTTSVKVDATAPDTVKGDVGPSSGTAVPSVSFSFTGADATSGLGEFECRLDGGAYELCTSPATRNALTDGPHTFDVRARDVAGNHDPTPEQWAWRVDTPPSIVVSDVSSGIADAPVEVDVLANDSDPLGRSLTPMLVATSTAKGGTVSLVGRKVRYVPPKGFAGTDTFTYRVLNGSGVDSPLGTVTIQVAAKPVALLDTLAPKLSKAKLKKRKLSFTLSEAGRVTVVVNEVVKGKKKPKRRGKVTKAGRSGKNTLAIAKKLLKKGRRYKLVITAVDAAGNASKARTITARIR